MAGGHKKIHLHPNAGTNNFKHRPQDAGRPKLPSLKDAIAKVLSNEENGKQALDAILDALKKKAAKGDVRAAKELLDRGYGTAIQKMEVETPSKIQVEIIEVENTSTPDPATD